MQKLIELVREQQAQIDALEKRVAELEKTKNKTSQINAVKCSEYKVE